MRQLGIVLLMGLVLMGCGLRPRVLMPSSPTTGTTTTTAIMVEGFYDSWFGNIRVYDVTLKGRHFYVFVTSNGISTIEVKP